MTVWGIRSGKYGERENLALDRGFTIIGWEELPDLSRLDGRDQLRELLGATYPDEKRKKLLNWESQIWPFIHILKSDDLVVMPLKKRSGFALGRITGPYTYLKVGNENLHTHPVEWMKEVPRSCFAQDLQYSFGAFLTVFKVARNDAERRVKAVINGQSDPALLTPPEVRSSAEIDRIDFENVATAPSYASIDIEQAAQDAIQFKLATLFKGHKLATLIAAILETEGYRTVVSPAGADGGVDILAGKGPLGFENPKLVVQVKSQDSSVDVSVLRELQGVMKQFAAEQGLLVAWGGVTKSLAREAQRLFFEIRVWDAGDILQRLLQNYERMSDDIKMDLPLKRIWAVANE